MSTVRTTYVYLVCTLSTRARSVGSKITSTVRLHAVLGNVVRRSSTGTLLEVERVAHALVYVLLPSK